MEILLPLVTIENGAFLTTLIVAIVVLRRSNAMRSIPTVATSLGIFFTFVGILIALYGFDVHDLQNSIPTLLEGMKLAFLSSVVGMFIAILYRLTPEARLWGSDQARSRGAGATIDTLAGHLIAIERALVGDGETTLNTQLQKLRVAVSDGNQALLSELKAFAEKVTENNVHALIVALEQVMRDFNTAINEQLGENFKLFNEGLGRVLEWQEQHRQFVASASQRLEQVLQAMARIDQLQQSMVDRSARFDKTAEHFEEVVSSYERILSELQGNLASFVSLGEAASSALPQIEKNVTRMTTEFAEQVKSSSNQIVDAATQQKEAIDDIVSAMRAESKAMENRLQELVHKTSENLATRFSELDEEMGNELTKAIGTLGSQLTSLSRKFVEDYTPLTQSLHRLIEVSRNSNGSY